MTEDEAFDRHELFSATPQQASRFFEDLRCVEARGYDDCTRWTFAGGVRLWLEFPTARWYVGLE